MRGVAILVILLLLVPLQSDPTDPTYTNRILDGFHRLDLAPGGAGSFDLRVSDPYNTTMDDVHLLAQVYRYSNGADVRTVDGTWPSPVFTASGSTTVALDLGPLQGERNLSLAIAVPSTAPHGGIFTEGTYLVRFRLEFNLSGNGMVMASPGFFPPAVWANATALGNRSAQYAALGAALGLPTIQGILPDSAFGVKDPLPPWPFYAAAALAALLGFLALAAYAAEAPGTLRPLEPLGRRLVHRGGNRGGPGD